MKRRVILLEDLIEVFRAELGHVLDDVDLPGPGRPPIYPAEALFLCWLLLYLGVVDSQRRLVQFLARHQEWRERLGFDDRVPDQSTLSWFKNHRASHIFPEVLDETVHRLVEEGVIRGEHLVVDASIFQAYSNPRKVDKEGTTSDPDASWGCGVQHRHVGLRLQDELHLVSCADTELPLVLKVTAGKRGDSPLFPGLVREASRFPVSMRVVGADGNYHGAVNHLEAHRLGASTVIPLPNRHHREPRTLAQRLRLHPLIQRGSALCRRLKRKRQSIERVFSRLKSHFHLDNLRVRGLARVRQHALLSLTSMLVYALTAAKLGLVHLVRSPTRLTT